ncbi:hypothetical protein [Sorangium sp. So ce1182]|uniref:hypothetical protein n=1 Tax=Sorangium sp. So ce1182 TaxID=3133334 RepID=UPI003F6459FB
MRAQSQSRVLASFVSLSLCASGCAVLLGLDEFTDQTTGSASTGTGGAGGSGGEDGACMPDTAEACYSGPPVTRNEGACRQGKRTCGAEATWSTLRGRDPTGGGAVRRRGR